MYVEDLTPGQGTLLEAAIDLRVPVIAFGITETHSEMLEDRLTSYCLQKLVDSSHTLYRQEAEQYLNGDGTWKEPKEEMTEASKNSKKVATKAKKKRKQATEDSNAEEENDKEDEEEEEEKKPAKKPTTKKRKAKKNEESSEDEEW